MIRTTMTFMYAALMCIAVAMTAPAAWAQTPKVIDGVETQGNVTKDDIEAARSYAAWGEAFGQEKLAYVAVDENKARMMITFLNETETLKTWDEMVTIYIFALPEDSNAQKQVVFDYIDGFRNFVAQQKESEELAVELKGFTGFSKEPPGSDSKTAEEVAKNTPKPQHALYQYAIGEETPDEDNAGIIFPLDGRLVNFQVQRRKGKTVSEKEVNQLSNFLMIQVNGGLTPAMRQELEKKAAEEAAQ